MSGSQTIGKNDKFRLNNKFTNPSKRLKIPLPPVDEKKKVCWHVETLDCAVAVAVAGSWGKLLFFPRHRQETRPGF